MVEPDKEVHSTDREEHQTGDGRHWFGRAANFLNRYHGLKTAIATILIAIVAALQWRTLTNTDETMRRSLVATTRAWIEPGRPEIVGDLDPTQPLSLVISYRNVGNAPATNAVVQLDEPLLTIDPPSNWYNALPSPNPVCKKARPNNQGISIYQSDAMQRLIYSNLDLPNAGSVADGSKILIVEGCIGYETVQESHYAAFCYYLKPDKNLPIGQWNWIRCQTRNDTPQEP